ncbi:MAG: DUF1036 domain-containing protein [Candidatus Eremiobacteraeota bacterium]|nr:DUF1036 domain-containing protein [Candidatus Eremiobacteraeota bacterium]MBV8205029.1 DUF1036 domain-containing protein [Candidatus Eremiobacteraeota bacterium]MBV8262321.1 DUF1036 domain-containing protein [Candidatus Eremiobacteraeota bacterium]MBV8338751.1 DUF1036 domain-containing protein [Candidatus Eremiobacteraeota bacterium]MBV8460708.1 DUF1036 domain-containing protein [Candidatus Eremiobacteraeota bacterium]
MRHLIGFGTVTALVIGVALFTSAPAKADLQVCNESGEHISIAVAYYDAGNDSMVSEGWWNMDSGDCRTPIDGDLKDKYYYLYAESDEHTWTGSHSFCLNPEHRFTLYDVDTRCDYAWTKFFQVDTGDADSYTQTIR